MSVFEVSCRLMLVVMVVLKIRSKLLAVQNGRLEQSYHTRQQEIFWYMFE